MKLYERFRIVHSALILVQISFHECKAWYAPLGKRSFHKCNSRHGMVRKVKESKGMAWHGMKWKVMVWKGMNEKERHVK
jgi:hypothetical protein